MSTVPCLLNCRTCSRLQGAQARTRSARILGHRTHDGVDRSRSRCHFCCGGCSDGRGEPERSLEQSESAVTTSPGAAETRGSCNSLPLPAPHSCGGAKTLSLIGMIVGTSECLTRWVLASVFLSRSLHLFSASLGASANPERENSGSPHSLPDAWVSRSRLPSFCGFCSSIVTQK